MNRILSKCRDALLSLALLSWAGAGIAQTSISAGITEPVILPAFDRSAAACTPPAGLQRQLVFLQDNDRQFMQGVRFGLEEAARKRNLTFTVERADNDAAKMAASLDAAAKAHAGAVIAAPVDAAGLAPSLQTAIGSGTYVATIVPPPAVTASKALMSKV